MSATPAHRLAAGVRARRLAWFALLPLASGAAAHITIWPRQSQRGAYEKYTVRVPNEKAVPTVRIEARVPRDVRVVSLEDKAGWTIEPARDSSGMITAVRWSGRLEPERFVEFGLIAVNPKAGDQLSWSFVQVYQDGSKVEWTGDAGTKTPASTVSLAPPEAGSRHH